MYIEAFSHFLRSVLVALVFCTITVNFADQEKYFGTENQVKNTAELELSNSSLENEENEQEYEEDDEEYEEEDQETEENDQSPDLHCTQVGLASLESAGQSKIEASSACVSTEEDFPSQIGKAEEEDESCNVAASPNLPVCEIIKNEKCLCSSLSFCTNVYLEGVAGRGIGFNPSHITFGGISCIRHRCFQPFIDIRSHYFENHRVAANLGGGFRFICPANQRTFGINFYYDYRQSHCTFNQVGLGFEFLGGCCDLFDLRLNFYLPVGNKIQKCCPQMFLFSGGFFAIAIRKQRALKGLDFEIETRLSRFLPCSDFDFYLAPGSYYYHSRPNKNIIGIKGRVGVWYQNLINLECRISYDTTFKTSYQGVIRLAYPFGTSNCCECCCTPFVRRQDFIVFDKKHCTVIKNY